MQDIIKIVRISYMPFERLLTDEQELLEKALAVRTKAQAPYSRYQVGAAILSNKNTIHTGCNVERCTYTQTTHAEQSAIDAMVTALGPTKITKIAIIGAPQDAYVSLTERSPDFTSALPCGHCLQTIWENCYQDADVKIFMLAPDNIIACSTIGDLLPFRFGPENLSIYY